jgi:hypothetical protein
MQTTPLTNHEARRLTIRDDRGLLLRPNWPTEQQSGARSRSGDEPAVRGELPGRKMVREIAGLP